jgi:Mg2+/citrate symporter
MQDTIKVYHTETKNNIYQIGYKVTAKTNYEQREEQRETIKNRAAYILSCAGIIACGWFIYAVMNEYLSVALMCTLFGLIMLLFTGKIGEDGLEDE